MADLKPWERYAKTSSTPAGPWTKYDAGNHVHPDDVAAMPDPGLPVPGTPTAQVGPATIPFDPMRQNKSTGSSNALHDTAAQGISGLHEGIASTLSLPNNLISPFLKVGPTVVNALTGSKFSTNTDYLPDAGKAYLSLGNDTGFIKPPDNNGGNQAVRTVGRYLGGMILPGEAALGAGAPLRSIAGDVLSGTGAGVGAATANAVAPGNPWAEMAGSIAGGGVTSGITAIRDAGAAKIAPAVSELKDQAGVLYQKAQSRGVVMPQQASKQLASGIRGIAAGAKVISPTGRFNNSYPAVVEVVKTFDDHGKVPLSVSDIQSLRQKITDAAESKEPGEARIATQMVKAFDAATDPLAPELAQGNAIYHRAMNGQTIETAIELAKANSERTGQSMEKTLRSEFGKLDRQIIDGDLTGLSPAEEDAIRKVARGGVVENTASFVGNFAPRAGLVPFAGAGVGYALGEHFGQGGGLGAGAVLSAGLAGRSMSTAMAAGNAAKASALSRRGYGAVSSPAPLGVAATSQTSNALRGFNNTMTLEDWMKQNPVAQGAGS